MGAQREDTDPVLAHATEPGIGPLGERHGRDDSDDGTYEEPTAPARPSRRGDFDALNAALDPAPTKTREPTADSGGRSSATYASSRPHALPKPHHTNTGDVPAVIVDADIPSPLETIPSAPPAMTVPLAHARYPAAPATPLNAWPPSPSVVPAARTPSQPPVSHSPPPGAAYPQQTAPISQNSPTLRPRTPTIVVRRREPSFMQKLAAFLAMLLLVTACGMAVILWRRPEWIGMPSAATSDDPSSVNAAATATELAPVPTAPVAVVGSSVPLGASAASASAAPPMTGALPAPRPRKLRSSTP